MSAPSSFPTLHAPSGPVPPDAPAWNPQRPGAMPSHRYRSAYDKVSVPLTDRAWPARRLTAAPLWVPVDLRDGNQALAEPMDTPRKRRMFDLMLAMGYKEIEVGYPSASQTDYDFVRHLATSGTLPDDVTVVVFTPAKPDLIERTFASIEGLPRAMVHMYTATAPTWRNVVLGYDRAGLHQLILRNAELVGQLADRHQAGPVRLQFSPEVFNLTEPDYVLEVCDALTELWDASPDRPVVHNLPATVEIASPNVYADQIEYMHRHLARRDSVILSVHPHNDRGTGVACAELAVLAGAQRVEGCLFGNGERTGNVDLVTLGLNLHAQGVDPMIDFSDIDEIRRVVEHCNRLPVHIRHPYVGDLVYTAFSGTHQDAIKKGMAHHAAQAAQAGVPEHEHPWNVPYLPIDPADVGRGYEAVIRVNSQSGKGGVAYLLQTEYGLDLPRALQPEFSALVQQTTDASGTEATAEDLYALFTATYIAPGTAGAVKLNRWSSNEIAPGAHECVCFLSNADSEEELEYRGTGNGPLSAFIRALADFGPKVDVLAYVEHAVDSGLDSAAVCYAQCRIDGVVGWGVGLDTSVLAASVRAVLSAVNRAGASSDLMIG
ncbi:2-isopropylmalate synthase [Actinospica robiniae]|uniref:2-isopropylmalate synthase n=1 Tax=Actinospica robiniae TaxID=304901 RepID=UPI0004027983|nr:2-isopropylmalate synthase [Actinospica robiniae]